MNHATNTAAQADEAERAEFEADIAADGYLFEVRLDWDEKNGRYGSSRTQPMFSGWKLARRRATQASAEPVGDAAGDLSPLDYRAQGREEALAIILAQEPEDPFAECTTTSENGDCGDYSTHWNEGALRELLHIGDRTHDAYDRAEAAYWEAQGQIDSAKWEMNLVKRAPFYKPLTEFLSKHQAWDLMASLKREADSAAPSSAPSTAERLDRAERALLLHGFEDLGGAEWKPPLGKPPRFIVVPDSAPSTEPATYVLSEAEQSKLAEASKAGAVYVGLAGGMVTIVSAAQMHESPERAPSIDSAGWQPITTAPKDGTDVLLYLGAPWNDVAKAYWFAPWENWQRSDDMPDAGKDEYCGIGSGLPTHWMPLPPPPVAAMQPQGKGESNG